jgi:hypothetical protein
MIINKFTKWSDIVTMPNQNSLTIAKDIIDNFISKFGAHHDLLQIVKARTTTYHPQSNDQDLF